MLFKILADVTVFVHFLWIIFLIFGAIPGRRYRLIKYIHLGGLAFAFMLQVFDWYCPLTYLEVWLRKQHAPSPDDIGSFIIYYLEKIIYIELDRWVITVLTMLLCAANIWAYRRGKRI